MPNLNDYTAAFQRNRYIGAAMKKEWTSKVSDQCLLQKLKPMKSPVRVDFEWYERNSRRDPDNVVFAKKFILDGLVKAGVLLNDTQKDIAGFTDSWGVVKGNEGVVISIMEVDGV